MSFDVFLVKFSGGKKAEADRVAVRQVLDRHKFNQRSDQDFFDVQFSDGSHVEFDTKGLSGTAEFSGCSFAIRGLSDPMVAFIFDVARAGGMVLFPAMEGALCILVDPSQKPDLPLDLNFTVVECHSAQELGALFVGGYEAWKDYRDRIREPMK